MLSRKASPKGPTCRERWDLGICQCKSITESCGPQHGASTQHCIRRYVSVLPLSARQHRACLPPSCPCLVKTWDFLRKWKLLIPWVRRGSSPHNCEKLQDYAVESTWQWIFRFLKDQPTRNCPITFAGLKNSPTHEDHTLGSLLWPVSSAVSTLPLQEQQH